MLVSERHKQQLSLTWFLLLPMGDTATFTLLFACRMGESDFVRKVTRLPTTEKAKGVSPLIKIE